MNIRVRQLGFGGSLLVLAVAALAGAYQLANGAVTTAWVRQHNSVVSNSLDLASAVLRDHAGNIIVAGYTHANLPGAEILLLKYSGANGSLLWARRYDGAYVIHSAAVDAHGNIAIAGYLSKAEDFDYYTAKFSPDGALVWARHYDGPSDDKAMAVALDASGNVVVTGGSSQDEWRNDDDGYTRYDYYTAKHAAADGALLWERRYDGPASRRDLAHAVAIDENNDVLVTGYSDTETNRENYTAKYAGGDGAVLWERRNYGPTAQAIALDGDGNVVVAGYSLGDGTYLDAHVAKYAGADGTLLWEQRRNGAAPGQADEIRAISVDGFGNVIVTGYLHSGFQRWDDVYTAKYAASDGALLWEQLYNGPASSSDAGQAVVVDANGNVLIAGYSFGNAWDHYTAKYAAADGALLWDRRQYGPWAAEGLKSALVLDPSGDVFVTGGSGRGHDPDIYTARYAGADGSVLWQQSYAGPSHRSGYAQAVAIDAQGNLFVTGDSEGEDSAQDYLTLKYAPNGALLWERRYDGPGNSADFPRSIALDSEGNAIVTGQSTGSAGSAYDFYTAKYAAADGALLWEQRYNGPGNWSDSPQALAVDRDGNILVTGSSYRMGASSLDFYTAKYAGNNGALQWERRFSPPTGSAAADGIAVDASGNAVVTGSVWTGPSNRTDFYTVKYAAADGRTLWERQYNGPGNGSDEPVAVAMDAEGNVFVTGHSAGGYTVKYAAATGEVIWEQRHNFGWPRALAVDVHGNAIVTSGGSYTIKYAASDGAVLWDKNIEGASNRVSIRAMALDAAANVFLAGMSYDGRDNDFFTAKYGGTDGAVLWEQYDDGPGHAEDLLENQRGLALGPNGMVAIAGSSGGIGYYFGRDFTTVLYRENLPNVSIFAPTPSVIAEFQSSDGFILTRTGDINSALEVFLQMSGTAANGVDYQVVPGSVTIPAGTRNARVSIVPINDSVLEADETVIVALALPPEPLAVEYNIRSPEQASLVILDDDAPLTPTGLKLGSGSPSWTGGNSPAHSSYALDKNGILFAWGDNLGGQLGLGYTSPYGTEVTIPAPVIRPSGVTHWLDFAAGMDHALALGSDGRLYAWGLNSALDVAPTNSFITVPTYVQVPSSARLTAVAAGASSFVLDSAGIIYAWGNNYSGQLGIGNNAPQGSPVPTIKPPGVNRWITVSAGYAHTLALADNGQLYAWGNNYWGQLGNGQANVVVNHTPVPIAFPPGVTSWKKISAGYAHSTAIGDDAQLYAWGFNLNGWLGTGTAGEPPTYGTPVPTRVIPPTGVNQWIDAAAGREVTMALASNGKLYSGTLSQLFPYELAVPPGSSTSPSALATANLYRMVLGADCQVYAGVADAPLAPVTGLPNLCADPVKQPAVNIFVTDARARERSGHHRLDTATFRVYRTGKTDSALTVYYDIAGTASNGIDYVRLPGTVTIPAGHRDARIVVIPQKDSLREGREQVVLTLRAVTGYTLGTRWQAVAHIQD